MCVRIRRIAVAMLVISAIAGVSGRARADAPPLTRARVAELVRAAPASRVAAAETAVARAAVEGADTLATDNPVLSGMLGARFNPDDTRRIAGTASLSWPIEIAGQRGARVDAARAGHRAAAAGADDARRRLLQAALLLHAQVLRDQRQLAIAAERRAVAARLLAAARRQRQAGAVPELDVTLAALQEARDAASEAGASGARDADQQALLALLGVATGRPAEASQVAGALVPPGEPPPDHALGRDLEARSEVRAASLARDAAAARAARERAARWPAVSVLAQYERDDGANIAMGGLSIPIPVLDANSSGVSVSRAEAAAAQARLEATRVEVSGALRQLRARFEATRRALESLRPTLALSAQAVALATRGYELGENDLASVLLVRREAVDTQTALLEAEHAHASAKIELLVAAGRVPQ
jgi:cobalt-zinc-cadmium efflux system outer membrane protein